jgi:hypothetical protein
MGVTPIVRVRGTGHAETVLLPLRSAAPPVWTDTNIGLVRLTDDYVLMIFIASPYTWRTLRVRANSRPGRADGHKYLVKDDLVHWHGRHMSGIGYGYISLCGGIMKVQWLEQPEEHDYPAAEV